ncbi:MAG: hypothetical protein P8X42_06670 [Calditrichaceae bacterium]
MRFLRYFIFWLPGIIIAICNAILRESLYLRFTDELGAHQLSVVSFILLFSIYVWLIYPFLKVESRVTALLIGGVWLILTILFEFLFGYYVMDHSWIVLFHDYNILEGRMWIIVLFWIFIVPYVVLKLRKRITKNN